MKVRRAFTLIELLIVVAIIAILAAIAVPNFLEAQMRAKVARARADMRSLATGQESYFIDYNSYTKRDLGDSMVLQGWRMLTTPVAYMTSIPRDVFEDAGFPGQPLRRVNYWYELGAGKPDRPGDFPNTTYNLSSSGPDKIDDTLDNGNFPAHQYTWNEATFPWPQIPENSESAVAEAVGLIYNPTNGTKSGGNVLRFGGVKPSGEVYSVLWQCAPAR